jgi:hypothetical protein
VPADKCRYPPSISYGVSLADLDAAKKPQSAKKLGCAAVQKLNP